MKKIGLLLTLLAVFANAEFVRTEKGTVKDTVTNLEWQDSYKDKDGNEADVYTTYFTNAINYCHDLDLDGKGWRLPNINELKTLIVDTQYAPAIDKAFKKVGDAEYWSSTTIQDHNNNAYCVHFNSGYLNFYNKGHDLYVRCVRGGE